MTVRLLVTRQAIESSPFEDWDAACGAAIREALSGAESVILIDSIGSQYDVWVEPHEDAP